MYSEQLEPSPVSLEAKVKALQQELKELRRKRPPDVDIPATVVSKKIPMLYRQVLPVLNDTDLEFVPPFIPLFALSGIEGMTMLSRCTLTLCAIS